MGAPGTTKGPWTVAHSTISWWIEAPTDMSRQLASGVLPADTWHMSSEDRRKCRAIANANQIAAAGDLYDALEPFTRTNPHKNEDGSSTVMIGCTVADIRRAIAALSKARGQ